MSLSLLLHQLTSRLSPAVSLPSHLSYCYTVTLRNTQYLENTNSISNLNETNYLFIE